MSKIVLYLFNITSDYIYLYRKLLGSQTKNSVKPYFVLCTSPEKGGLCVDVCVCTSGLGDWKISFDDGRPSHQSHSRHRDMALEIL